MKNTRILIVDPTDKDVQLMTIILRNAGYGMVRSLGAPVEAVQLCEAFKPHLVLLNIASVEHDKVTFFHKIRELFLDGNLPQVLAFSADPSRRTRRRALEAGADDFLPKPLDFTEFLLRCARLVRVKKIHDQLLAQIGLLDERIRFNTAPAAELQFTFSET